MARILPSLLKPTSTRNRLWQAGAALAIFILTMAIGNIFSPPGKAVTTDMLGLDFLPFYASGAMARTGRTDLLYDIPAVAAFEHETAKSVGLNLGDAFGPFWNPPFYAWVFAPLSMLPYRQALAVWTLINVAALGVSFSLLIGMLPKGTPWQSYLLVPLLMLVSIPFIQAISHGQNTFTSLLLLCCCVTAWRARQALWAGIFCGLLCYKPQHAAVLGAIMTLTLGRRTLLGLCGTVAMLTLITAITMPGAMGDWIHRLPMNVHFMQVENPYSWERHTTLKAFWRMLLQGHNTGEARPIVNLLTALFTAAACLGLLSAIMRCRKPVVDDLWTNETSSVRMDRLIAAAVTATPLVMPFYFDYDLLLLAVPAVLFAGEMLATSPGKRPAASDRWLMRSWVLLFAMLLINGPLSHFIGIGLIAPPLALVAGFSIMRARRQAQPDRSPARCAEEIGAMLEIKMRPAA
jgi:hypothetical protein